MEIGFRVGADDDRFIWAAEALKGRSIAVDNLDRTAANRYFYVDQGGIDASQSGQMFVSLGAGYD